MRRRNRYVVGILKPSAIQRPRSMHALLHIHCCPPPLPPSLASPLFTAPSMHYFRIHPDYWEDRLERAAAMGLNTVEVGWVGWVGGGGGGGMQRRRHGAQRRQGGAGHAGHAAVSPTAQPCDIPVPAAAPCRQVYIPWNFHEPYPGEYLWRGWADVERWLQLIQARQGGGLRHALDSPCLI